MSGLAEHGVVFDNAYTASPLCSPARASLMTGLLPSRTHAYDNAAEFASEIPTFAHYLRGAGYRTVLSGKMHFCGPDQLHGFEERLTTDIYPADYGWTPDWDRPRRPRRTGTTTCRRSSTPARASGPTSSTSMTRWRSPPSGSSSGTSVPTTIGRSASSSSFSHPHDPYAIPREWWDLYRDADIPMPEYGLRRRRPASARAAAAPCVRDGRRRRSRPNRCARRRRAYYGAISYVDDHIARLMDVLRATAVSDDTVVILTSDHGDMLGERGLWYKMSFFEGSARVPLVVSAPSRFRPGSGRDPGVHDGPAADSCRAGSRRRPVRSGRTSRR